MNNLTESKCGPFRCRTDAIEAGKADRLSILSDKFTLIKSRSTGSFDYVPGTGHILSSDDLVQADYFKSLRGKWAHTLRKI